MDQRPITKGRAGVDRHRWLFPLLCLIVLAALLLGTTRVALAGDEEMSKPVCRAWLRPKHITGSLEVTKAQTHIRFGPVVLEGAAPQFQPLPNGPSSAQLGGTPAGAPPLHVETQVQPDGQE